MDNRNNKSRFELQHYSGADVITEGLSLEKCFEISKQIFKNRKPRFVKIDNIRIEKKGKQANKEFEKDLGENGKKSVSFTELLDFALNNGYTVKELQTVLSTSTL